jgi:hypothetical protein
MLLIRMLKRTEPSLFKDQFQFLKPLLESKVDKPERPLKEDPKNPQFARPIMLKVDLELEPNVLA